MLCRPKELGGYGPRRAEGMNKAMLAKLAWRLIMRQNELWTRIISKKYGMSEDGPVVFRKKQEAFAVWRGLKWAGELLSRGLSGRL